MNFLQATYFGFSVQILTEVIALKGSIDGRKDGELLIVRNVTSRARRYAQHVTHIETRRLKCTRKFAADSNNSSSVIRDQ